MISRNYEFYRDLAAALFGVAMFAVGLALHVAFVHP